MRARGAVPDPDRIASSVRTVTNRWRRSGRGGVNSDATAASDHAVAAVRSPATEVGAGSRPPAGQARRGARKYVCGRAVRARVGVVRMQRTWGRPMFQAHASSRRRAVGHLLQRDDVRLALRKRDRLLGEP